MGGPPMSTFVEDEDDFWEDLLAAVEERRVIPIIGPELLQVRDGEATVSLNGLLATRLRDRLRLNPAGLPADCSLNDVVCQFLRQRGRREEIYPKLRSIMKELTIEPPEALRQLARVGAFDLFVSLTFDSLLVDALNQERFAGAARTDHLACSPTKTQDLPAERSKLTAPVVVGLFGKLSVAPDYAVTEEDTLEFLHALQSDAKRPHLLFDELQSNNLLFIGCPFPDWLARFFIRTAKSRQLSAQRGETEILVDEHLARDSNLVLFLESFSYGTRIASMNPQRFVAELHRRWVERHPPRSATAPLDAMPAAAASIPDMEPGAIFLSYAKEDLAAAKNLRQALERLGIDVWFDKDRLEAGDLYDIKIKKHVRACSLFMPVISNNALQRVEGYFRREWRLADERTMGIADGVPFVIPVVVDATPEYCDMVPESFKAAQWTRLPGGEATPEFEARLVKLMRDYRKREKGLA
jgi:hypothetical protein